MKTLHLAFVAAALIVTSVSVLLAGVPLQTAATRGAAPSLVHPATPSRVPSAAGFIQRWLLLEPIPVSGQLTDSAVQAAVKKDYFPNQLTVIPREGETVMVGNTSLAWHAVDTVAYNVNLFHFARALNKPTSNVLFWAISVVNAPRDMPDVRLAIGSNAASVWWMNGEEVIGIYNDRQTVIDDGVSKRLTLKRGPNVIRAAIINAGGATDFCARLLDEHSRPVKGYTISLSADERHP